MCHQCKINPWGLSPVYNTVTNICYDVIICACAVNAMARVNFENAFTLSRGWSIKSATSANKKSEEEVNSICTFKSYTCRVKRNLVDIRTV